MSDPRTCPELGPRACRRMNVPVCPCIAHRLAEAHGRWEDYAADTAAYRQAQAEKRAARDE